MNEFFMDKEYDKFSIKRIASLISLKNRIHGMEKRYINDKKIELYENKVISSAFSEFSCHIDFLLYYFISDESLVVLNNRGPLKYTIAKSIEELILNEDISRDKTFNFDFDFIKKDIEHMFTWRNDFMLGYMFHGFSVSNYSVFESWMRSAFDKILPRKKIKSIYSKYGKYNVPSKVIVDEILSTLKESKKSSFNLEIEMINVLRLIRNTIHSGGYYHGKKEIIYKLNGKTTTLSPEKPILDSDYTITIDICSNLIDFMVLIFNHFELDLFFLIDKQDDYSNNHSFMVDENLIMKGPNVQN